MNNGNGNNGHANRNGTAQLPTGIGGEIGDHGVDQLFQRAAQYCSCERQRREAENQPKIAAAQAEQTHVDQQLNETRSEVAKLPPEGDLRSRRRRALFEFAFAAILTVAGFAFSLAALEPFQLGWKGVVYSLGLALIVPYSIDMLLQHYAQHLRFVRTLAIVAAGAALLAMVSLSLIRTQLVQTQLQHASPAVVIEGDTQGAPDPQPVNTFYDKTQLLLSLFMVLAAIGMELNAGCALFNGRRLWGEVPPNAAELRRKLAELEQKKVAIVQQINTLEQGPQEFVNGYWRDFHESLVKGTQRSSPIVKMWTLLLFAALLFCGRSALARDSINLVIAVDLSESVAAAAGPDNKTEYDKDIAAVSHLLASAPAGAHITVIGITDQSFSRPYVLLSAQLDPNEGYFHERIALARRELLQAWQKRSQTLVSRTRDTDLFGSLILASQIFHSESGHNNVLVILSDMRHETGILNFARFRVVPGEAILKKVQAAHLVADLKGVDVYALGVDAAGKSVAYWDSLRDFWTGYFRQAGAVLKSYSMLREMPALKP